VTTKNENQTAVTTLVYNGRLCNCRDGGKSEKGVSKIKNSIIELNEEQGLNNRLLVISDVVVLGEADMMYYSDPIGVKEGAQTYHVGTVFFKKEGTSEVFAVVLLKKEPLPYRGITEVIDLEKKYSSPVRWSESTTGSEIFITFITGTEPGKTATSIDNSQNVPESLRKHKVKNVLTRIQVLGNLPKVKVSEIFFGKTLCIEYTLFSASGKRYVKSELTICAEDKHSRAWGTTFTELSS